MVVWALVVCLRSVLNGTTVCGIIVQGHQNPSPVHMSSETALCYHRVCVCVTSYLFAAILMRRLSDGRHLLCPCIIHQNCGI